LSVAVTSAQEAMGLEGLGRLTPGRGNFL
jgi:hypothetical protein